MPANRNNPLAAAFLGLVLFTGCSGIKSYRTERPANFHVRTEVDSESSLKSTVAEFDIHLVGSLCETEYLGRVYLDRPTTDVGVPVNRPVFLDFIFASKAFLSTTTSAVRYQTVLTPRSGFRYDVRISYIKGIYNVVIREKQRGATGSGTTVPRKQLSNCKPVVGKRLRKTSLIY